jgi:hypothetical protein
MTSTVSSLSLRNLCRMLISHDGSLVGCLKSHACLLPYFSCHQITFDLKLKSIHSHPLPKPSGECTGLLVSPPPPHGSPFLLKFLFFFIHYNLTTVSPPSIPSAPPCLFSLSQRSTALPFPFRQEHASQ